MTGFSPPASPGYPAPRQPSHLQRLAGFADGLASQLGFASSARCSHLSNASGRDPDATGTTSAAWPSGNAMSRSASVPKLTARQRVGDWEAQCQCLVSSLLTFQASHGVPQGCQASLVALGQLWGTFSAELHRYSDGKGYFFTAGQQLADELIKESQAIVKLLQQMAVEASRMEPLFERLVTQLWRQFQDFSLIGTLLQPPILQQA